ncbi:alpha/beta hydrolase [Echinicola salinicaeni]|uniref:alpha/beta hydrolase n=1 Tax=Echinicola salinicaeni TaxID=2762757 RepID=UPI001645A246|nr:alpha/beta fold hydrolase [Echinicola salinicaeni]
MKSKIFLFIFCLGLLNQSFAIKPDREYFMTPDSINWNYEQLKITTEDGYELNSWIYEAKPENNKDTVLVLAYPDAGNMSYFVYYAGTLANAGYTVITFDYRGFGKSDDFEIQPDYLYYTEFSKDLEAVINTARLKFKGKKLGIWAMSMGTTITSRAYPNIKDKVDFIIGEGYVTDTMAIIDRYKAKEKLLVLPEESFEYRKAIVSIDVPLLIFTASKDSITTHQDALDLQEVLGGHCKVIPYPGEHLSGFSHELDNKGFGGWYVEQINSFVAGI